MAIASLPAAEYHFAALLFFGEQEEATRARVAMTEGAVMANSVPVDLYSLLLGRLGVYSERGQGGDLNAERDQQLALLGDYLMARLDTPPGSGGGAERKG